MTLKISKGKMISLILILCISACAPTIKHQYGVHNFKLYPEQDYAGLSLEDLSLVFVRHPLYVTKIGDKVLPEEYIFRSDRTYDIIELLAGQYSFKVKYRNNTHTFTDIKLSPGTIYFIDYKTYGEGLGLVGLSGTIQWKLFSAGYYKVVSPNGSRSIYIERDKSKTTDNFYYVVEDGAKKIKYDIFRTRNNYPVFSPNSKRIAFRYNNGEKWRVVVDGVEGKNYDDISSLLFSPNNEIVAYFAKNKEKWFAVIDGKEGKPYDSLKALKFSPDSTRIAYFAKEKEKWFAVIDGKEGKPYDSLEYLEFSPDSIRIAYFAKVKEKGRLDKRIAIVDGKEGKPYNRIDSFKFSPDSKRYAYRGIIETVHKTDRDNAFVIVDGIEGKKYNVGYKIHSSYVLDGLYIKEYHNTSNPTFSPDSNKVFYRAMITIEKEIVTDNKPKKIIEKEFLVVVDGREEELFDDIKEPIVLSPDNKKIAYIAAIRDESCVNKYRGSWWFNKYYSLSICNRWYIVVNEQKYQKKYTDIKDLVLSSDGESIAYAAIPSEGPMLWLPVVNEIEIRNLSHDIKDMRFSRDGKVFYYNALKGKRGWSLIENDVTTLSHKYPQTSETSNVRMGMKIQFIPNLGDRYKKIDKIPDNMGIVYFYRIWKFFGAGGQFSIIVNENNGYSSVPIVNGGYYPYFLKPGQIEIINGDESQALNVKAGKTYFLRGDLRGAQAKIDITSVPNAVAEKEIVNCKLVLDKK